MLIVAASQVVSQFQEWCPSGAKACDRERTSELRAWGTLRVLGKLAKDVDEILWLSVFQMAGEGPAYDGGVSSLDEEESGMKLGFVTAIMPDLGLEDVLRLGRECGYQAVEAMCWPRGKAERRYAGVTHVDVTEMTQAGAEDVLALAAKYGMEFSGLGYYPNLLSPSEQEREVAFEHLKRVMRAARLMGLDTVSTFIGRDWKKSVEENWPMFLAIWPELVRNAEDQGVRIAIENCPMLFTADEWPGGKNLASSPAIWERMFEAIPSRIFGLNYDPSHLVWQHQDYLAPLEQFRERIFRIHVKDAAVDQTKLNQVGMLAYPLEFHAPVLPGLGDVDWRRFFAALRGIGYDSYATVEVEDRRYETDMEHRTRALVESAEFLRPIVG